MKGNAILSGWNWMGWRNFEKTCEKMTKKGGKFDWSQCNSVNPGKTAFGLIRCAIITWWIVVNGMSLSIKGTELWVIEIFKILLTNWCFGVRNWKFSGNFCDHRLFMMWRMICDCFNWIWFFMIRYGFGLGFRIELEDWDSGKWRWRKVWSWWAIFWFLFDDGGRLGMSLRMFWLKNELKIMIASQFLVMFLLKKVGKIDENWGFFEFFNGLRIWLRWVFEMNLG